MAQTVFIAKHPIRIGYALAHNVGDEVPAKNVKANGWQDLVEERSVEEPVDEKSDEKKS